MQATTAPRPAPRWHHHTDGFAEVYFDDGSAAISDEDALDDLADQLITEARPFRVVGHADANESNPQLVSAMRARAVVQQLVVRGVPESALDLAAVGSSDPADLSRTESARARNRRVRLDPVRTRSAARDQ